MSLKISIVILFGLLVGISALAIEDTGKIIKGVDGKAYRIVRNVPSDLQNPLHQTQPLLTSAGKDATKPALEKKTSPLDETSGKSAAKPEDVDKARTHSLGGLGLESILQGIAGKLHGAGLGGGLGAAYPVASVQPISTHYVSQVPYYQQSYYSQPAAHISPIISQQVIKPVVSAQVVQKPVYTISQQVIHKPVYTEIQEVIRKPVYTEVQEVIHKPVYTELQQVIKKPLFTEHVVKKPSYNAVKQEVITSPLHLQGEQYHVVDKPVSQVFHLPQQIVQPYASQVVHSSPVYTQQAAYHVPAVPAVSVLSSGYSAPLASSVVSSSLPVSAATPVYPPLSPSYFSGLHSSSLLSSSLPVSSVYPGPYSSSYISSGLPLSSGYSYSSPLVSSLGLSGYGGYSSYAYSSPSYHLPAAVAAPAISAPISSSAIGYHYPLASPAIASSVVSSPVVGLDHYDSYHSAFYTPSECRTPGGCGRSAEDGADFKDTTGLFSTQMGSDLQPMSQFQAMTSPYGVGHTDSMLPMPYMNQFNYQQTPQFPLGKSDWTENSQAQQYFQQGQQYFQQGQPMEATGTKTSSGKGDDNYSSYLVPAEGSPVTSGMSSQNLPSVVESQQSKSYYDSGNINSEEQQLKSAIDDEQQKLNALKGNVNVDMLVKKIQDNPVASQKIRNIIEELMMSDMKSTGVTQTKTVVNTPEKTESQNSLVNKPQ